MRMGRKGSRGKFSIVIALCLLLAACGGAEESSEETESSSSDGQAQEPSSGVDETDEETEEAGGSETADEDEAAADLTERTFSLPARSVGYTSHYVAAEMGFWEEEGLKINLETMTPSTAVAAIISGDVSYVGALGSTLRSAVNGSGLVLIAEAAESAPFRLIAQPDFSEVTDLSGTQVGVTNVGSSTHVFAINYVRENGLDESEVTFINCNTTTSCLQVLQAGAVSATVLSPPHSQIAVKDGMVALSDQDDFPSDEPAYGIGTSTDYVSENREEVVALTRGLLRAMDFIRNNRKETIEFITDFFELEPDIAEAAYDDILYSTSEDGVISEERVQNGIDSYRQEADISNDFEAGQALDSSIVEEANAG